MFISDYVIQIKNLNILAKIGVREQEKNRIQTVVVNLELQVTRKPGDYYKDIVCYDEVATMVSELAVSDHFELLETLANEVIIQCLKDTRVKSVQVSIAKPEALEQAEAACIAMQASRD